MSNIIDKIVGFFSPASALQRMQARRVYDYANRNEDQVNRAFEAAKIDRLNKNWNAQNRSADAEIYYDADTVRARARDLVQNNAYAKGVVRAKVRNIVGSGIKPQSRVELPDGKPNEEFNNAAEKLWNRFQRVIDAAGS